MVPTSLRLLVVALCLALVPLLAAALPPAPWPAAQDTAFAPQAEAPPPGAGAVNAVVRVEYFWQGVSGLTSVEGHRPHRGTLLGNILGPESVILTPTHQVHVIQCPGGTDTAAKDLNDDGGSAGFCTTRHGDQIGWLRSSTGRYTEIRVPQALRTAATTLNIHDHVGGDTRGTDGVTRGFVWTGGRRFTVLTVQQSLWTSVTGLNTHDDATGFFVTAQGHVRGWLARGRRVYAVDVPGALDTVPVHITDAREITGVYSTATGEVRSFVLTSQGYQDIAVPEATITDVAGMRDGLYWGRYLVPGDTDEMPWLSYGFVARLVPQPLPPAGPPPPSVAFRSSAMRAPHGGLTLALCERTGGPGTLTPGKLLGRQGGCS